MKGVLAFVAKATSIVAYAAVASASTLWSGSFNGYASAADFDKWSWSNQVGAYQWYIHGSGATSKYLAVSPSYKNPALTSETNGLKLTLDNTSIWNGQSFWRTELIPQTSTNIGTGHIYYHFSVKHTATNPPRSTFEHQVLFFESHFTEFKYGVGSNPSQFQWFVGGTSQWSTNFDADVWYNFAYDIDFSAGTVGLWASTGSNPLLRVHAQVSASTSTNSADWHLGVLAFASGSVVEDWYFSGVWVEGGTLTTAIGSGSSTGTVSVTPTVSSTKSVTPTVSPTKSVTPTVTPTPTPSTTTTAPVATQTHYGQCGGNGWAGPTVCASPYTCVKNGDWYSQCL